MSVKTGISDLLNGIRILVRGTRGSTAVGDKKLAYMSRIVTGQIEVYGVRAVRNQVIKSIESDFKRAAKKGFDETEKVTQVEKIMQNALATPDYTRLLHRLGLEEPHIRVIAIQALKERARKGTEQRRRVSE